MSDGPSPRHSSSERAAAAAAADASRSGGAAPARPWLARLTPPALVALAVLALYAPALGRGFTSEDFLLVRYLGEQPPWGDLRALLTEPWLGITVVRFLRPVATLLYGVEIAAFGAWAPGYGVVHLLVHVTATLLVWAIARRSLAGPLREPSRAPAGMDRAAAAEPTRSWLPAAVALVFGLYPLHPNAVLFGASFATLFGGAFALAALLAYLRFRAGNRRAWGAAFVSFALALGSYEATVVLPAWLAAYDHLTAGRHGRPRHRSLLAGWLPFAGLAGLYLLWRRWVFGVVLGGYEATGERLLAPRLGELAGDVLVSLQRLHLPWFGGTPQLALAAGLVAAVVVLPLVLASWRRPVHGPWPSSGSEPAAAPSPAPGLPSAAGSLARSGALSWPRAWVFSWVVLLTALAPFAFQPVVPATGRYVYLAAAGMAIALGALALGVTRALPRRWAFAPPAALVAVTIAWAVLLVGNLGTLRAAAATAATVRAEIVRVGAGAPGATLFVTGYPYFLADDTGMPLAQVFHYGLRDSVRPPFRAPAVSVYPLPPLAGAELLPVLDAGGGALAVAWDPSSGTITPVPTPPAAGFVELEPVTVAAAPRPAPRAGHPDDVRVAVRVPPGNHVAFRLLLAAPINGIVLPVTARPGPAGVLRARVPGELVAAVRQLYGGGTIYWWVEARDGDGSLSGWSRMRPLTVPPVP